MQTQLSEDTRITNTTTTDFAEVHWLFEEAMRLQGQHGYKVWNEIDRTGLENDIREQLQYKITKDSEMLGVFSVQHSDPLIWGSRDQDDAIYLHRIVVHPKFRGQRLFARVLDWARNYARQHDLKYVRMDTWADNEKIIHYYQSYGFQLLGFFQTSYNPGLPIQNRNQRVALLELNIAES